MNWKAMFTPRVMIRNTIVGLVAAAMIGIGVGAYKYFHWKNFAVVAEGKIYRSGQLQEHQLAKAIDKLGLKTVVCFNDEYADREEKLCKDKGIKFVYLPMHSDGRAKPEQYREALNLVGDPANQPALVHCYAGVARTGATIALYRMTVDGWTFDDAIEELKTFEKNGGCSPELRKHIQKTHKTLTKPARLTQAETKTPAAK
ncbi:MAG: fused DSP-PTPase phosphatase/NAD kinase-like protein [Planctomycetia bacterium]